MISTLREVLGFGERSYQLTVPRSEENEGLLILGDPGTGKSQVIHQLLDHIASRNPKEAVVCYDPAGEFIERHFEPNDVGVVVNVGRALSAAAQDFTSDRGLLLAAINRLQGGWGVPPETPGEPWRRDRSPLAQRACSCPARAAPPPA